MIEDTAQVAVVYNKLIRKIQEANRRYYADNDPIMSDVEYDDLMRQLRDLETQYPMLMKADSPTQKVGVAVPMATVRHQRRMLSLANAMNMDEVNRWLNRLIDAGLYEDTRMRIEWKADGLTAELVYVNGELTTASTRGDGDVGEDVTETIRYVEGVPLKLEGPGIPEILVVYGEVAMTRPMFETVNAQRSERGERLYSNLRQAAAGRLNQTKDPTLGRSLVFLPFDAMFKGTTTMETLTQMLEWLRKIGFREMAASIPVRWSDIATILTEMAVLRAEGQTPFGIDVDGAVLKVDHIQDRRVVGETSHHPVWAVAYKFEAAQHMTRVESVIYQVGRTGVITPVGVVEPVNIGGVRVNRAVLHNADRISGWDLRIGDKVMIRRAADVVPEIVSVVLTPDREKLVPVTFPTYCPSCGGALVMEGAFTRCTAGYDCPGQLAAFVTYLVSRQVFDVDGIAETAIQRLVESATIREPYDLWKLTLEEMVDGCNATADTYIQVLHKRLETSRHVLLYTAIMGLGIPGVGVSTAKLLANAYGSMDRFHAAQRETLAMLPDIGPTTSKLIHDFLNSEHGQGLIQGMAEAGFTVTDERQPFGKWAQIEPPKRATARALQQLAELQAICEDPSASELPLKDKIVVVTGTMVGGNRDEIRTAIEKLGGKSTSDVTSRTTCVVAGATPSDGKLQAARRMGIPIYDESWLWAHTP